jgi:hypothetical protein
MSVSSANAPAGGKTRYVETLTSGTSWTVPAGVEYVNATLIGGGGAGGRCANDGSGFPAGDGTGGQIISTTVTTTPGASIAYAIGAGGTAAPSNGSSGGSGGSTTFTGATTALGGNGGGSNNPAAGTNGLVAFNHSNGTFQGGNPGVAGGAGQIILEYWK